MIHSDIIDRYDGILHRHVKFAECRPEPGTEPCHLRWMLQQIREGLVEDKAYRWLGFIQGVMIAGRMTTVTVERDFTRPYFTSATN